MDDRELKRALLRGLICGKCGREARIGPCVCSPALKPTPVKVEDLDAAIRERLDDGRDGDAVRAVLDLHAPGDDERIGPDGGAEWGRVCIECGTEVPGSYPCPTVRAIATALGIEIADA